MDTNFYEQICGEEKRLEGLLEALRLLKGNYQPNGQEKTNINVPAKIKLKKARPEDKPYLDAISSTPDKFHQNLSQIHKTVYALRITGRGFTDAIATNLKNIDDEFTFEKAKKTVTYHLSKMYRLGVIQAEKVGNKNRYYI